jgi:hypothetical protein
LIYGKIMILFFEMKYLYVVQNYAQSKKNRRFDTVKFGVSKT